MIEPETGPMLEGGGALEKLQTCVKGSGVRDRAREQYVPGFELGCLDAGKVQGRPSARAGDLGGPAMILDAAHTRAVSGGGVERVARVDLPAPQRARRQIGRASCRERV